MIAQLFVLLFAKATYTYIKIEMWEEELEIHCGNVMGKSSLGQESEIIRNLHTCLIAIHKSFDMCSRNEHSLKLRHIIGINESQNSIFGAKTIQETTIFLNV